MNHIKDFILSPSASGDVSVTANARPAVEYSVVLADGPDFVIRRKTKRTSTEFVCIVSQGQFYIKNEITGAIEQLAEENGKKFTEDLPEDGFEIVEENGRMTSWIKNMQRGARWMSAFISWVRSPELTPYLKAGMLSFDQTDLHSPAFNRSTSVLFTAQFKDVKTVFDVLMETRSQENVVKILTENLCAGRNIFSEFLSDDGYYGRNDKYVCYTEIYGRWGIDGVRNFLRAFETSKHERFPTGRVLCPVFYRHDLLRDNDDARRVKTYFQQKDFLHYLFVSSFEQGYGDDIRGFCDTWADYLNQQYTLYGKVEKKYSAVLASDEKILAYKIVQLNKTIDEERWAAAVERMKKYEWQNQEFAIICPKTPDDLMDEGRQQSNCVASYNASVANGRTMIFFLRRTDAPDDSVVTIEIRRDGSLGQVRERFNHKPANNLIAVVNKWYNEVVVPNFGDEPPMIEEQAS